MQVPSALQTVEVKLDCTCPYTDDMWISDTTEVNIELITAAARRRKQ
jgi:hypothetical protein